jgi:hypothetical protein
LMSSAATARSTGPAPAWTRSACAPNGGRTDRPEPDRPRQARIQVPLAGRSSWRSVGGRAVSDQHPRLGAAGDRCRCGPGDQRTSGAAGAAAQAARQAAPGQGGYDHPSCRQALRRRGITPRIARRGVEPRDKLGRHRYVVERSLAWLVGHRRLQVRYEPDTPASCWASFTWPAHSSASTH